MLDLSHTDPQDRDELVEGLAATCPSNMQGARLRSWVAICEWEDDEGDVGINVRFSGLPWAAYGLMGWVMLEKESFIDPDDDE